MPRISKSMSMIMALCLCLAMLAPVFVVAPAADAASNYSVLKTQSVSAINTALTQPIVQVNVPNVTSVSDGDVLTIDLPSGLSLDDTNLAANARTQLAVRTTAGTIDVATGAALAGGVTPAIIIEAPQYVDGGAANAFDAAGSLTVSATGNSINITSNQATVPFAAGCSQGQLYIRFNDVLVTDTFDGDIQINASAPDNSGFSSVSNVAIGKYVSGAKGTTTKIAGVASMGTDAKTMENITIQETVTGALKAGEVITLDLPSGFSWTIPNVAGVAISGDWGFSNAKYSTTGATATTAGIPASAATILWGTNGSDKLYVVMPTTVAETTQGRLTLSGVQVSVSDDNVAKKGDVVMNVSSNPGNVTDQDITIASYVDYTVTVESVEAKDVLAGWDNTELGSFRIKEGLGGSILPGRTISLTLPEGAKWNIDNDPATLGPTWPYLDGQNAFVFEGESGSITLAALGGYPRALTNNGRTVKLTLAQAVGNNYSKSSFILKKLNVSIAPDFTPGDLNVEVGGTAGVTGTVKVANVLAPATISSDGAAKIVIGAQGQKAGDITIKESKKEAFKTGQAGNNNNIVVALPAGASWTVKPTVEVTEGDATIDTYSTNDNKLNITIKSTSSKPATIKISNVQVTTNRTVPEGDFEVRIVGASGLAGVAAVESGALTDNAGFSGFNIATITSAVIGKCVTPAPGEGTSGSAAGQFKIGSNIYQVNGVSKVMDVAPYIKNDRTYVPVRYLGYALGVAEDDVVWDAATQKVTLTLGDQKVELTIGSTTITVNGEAQTMDVAPEITNDRTMLPARFVAEGLGFQVGWDQSTGTVLISK